MVPNIQLAFGRFLLTVLVSVPFLLPHLPAQSAEGFAGYYRFPDIHDDKIVFTAEGDLWTVGVTGGLAQRLTTHAEEEMYASFSPDGNTIAFTASYEGPAEVYTMPVSGGLPMRWTYERDFSRTNTWTSNGLVVYDTRAYATLPDRQLVTIDPTSKEKHRIPLAQASEATFDDSGKTLYFVRPAFHGNVTKRYKGGTARQIWAFTEGAEEARQLTTDYSGESFNPMWAQGRIYFITDRDGIKNIWSIDENGEDLTQHTRHTDFDVRYANYHNGRIIYQRGADLWLFDVAADQTQKLDIRLATDLDQLREKWEDHPERYITSVEPDPKGERIVLTARGRVFVVPVKSGRHIAFTDPPNVRYREAIFSADGESIYALSDERGEFEFVRMPADGIGDRAFITGNGEVLRYGGQPSPDGKWLAFSDLENRLFLVELATGEVREINTNLEGIYDYSWSPDSKWLAFVQPAFNTMNQIHLYQMDTGDSFPLTTDRANSQNPRWSPDGRFIYFLSDRNFQSLVGSPWGARQPEPYFDASEKVYHIPLQRGTRSPFRPADELYEAPEEGDSPKPDSVVVHIDRAGIQQRIAEVPVKPGNYSNLAVTDEAIYVASRETGIGAQTHLQVLTIGPEKLAWKTITSDIRSFQLTADRTQILLRKGNNFYLFKAGSSPLSDLSQHQIDLSDWRFRIHPREDWKQIFTDAWRMERDYFYDKNMHGVDWQAMHNKYFPLVDRVTTRSELSDLIGRFVGELSALHTSVRGGDERKDELDIAVASLGGRFSRDITAGGYRIDYIYRADPDYPHERSPLDDPYLDIRIGDVITHVDGRDALSAVDLGALIRNKAGKQVRLGLKRGETKRDVIVTPVGNTYSLRYRDWEYSRRLKVEEQTDDQVGYVHLRAMGRQDLNQWYREFYPVFNRPGLIIDVRHNRGGNIESFILEKLLRKAWMYWKSRSGKPYWNMQYAFRGHIVVLVDQVTASDGEAFADGFRRLNLGTTIGMRTWGGEIWLSSVNRLTDGGLARAPMMGVYGPEGEWLIEGHGFEPDIEVDNLPHATFRGEDAQLEAAISFLQKKIAEDPREVPPVPPYPDKSFKN